MKTEFRKKLETLLEKNSENPLSSYIKDCINTYDIKNSQEKETVNPFGVDLNKMPNASEPIPANIGNTTTTGWSNPFGGTSWGV